MNPFEQIISKSVKRDAKLARMDNFQWEEETYAKSAENERPLCLIVPHKKETKKRKRKFNNYIRRMRYRYKKSGMKIKIKKSVHGIVVTIIHNFHDKDVR